MKQTLVWLLLTLFTAPAFGGDDTPFFFLCTYGKAKAAGKGFLLKFKDDDSAESLVWKSEDWKGTEIRFDKQSRQIVSVKLTTGMPLIGTALPEEYRFSAPLSGGHFDFSFLQRLVGVAPETRMLLCVQEP